MGISKRFYKATGTTSYIVDLEPVNGKRRQKTFPTLQKAKAALEELKEKRRAHGQLGRDITPEQLAELVALRERCAALGGTLGEAVEFWAAHGKNLRESIFLPELLARFLASKEESNRSARYRRQLKVGLTPFVTALSRTLVKDVTSAHVTRWLRGNAWAAKTQNNYLGDCRAMFAWGLKRGLCLVNPCEGVESAKEVESEIKTLSVKECETLLRAALKKPAVMPYLVIGLFGGVRPAEIERLTWSHVDLEHKTVIVAGGSSKTGSRRVVDLTDNAVRWIRAALPPGAVPTGPICPKGFRMLWYWFKRDLGYRVYRVDRAEDHVKEWPHDVLRHSYASYHFAHHNKEAKLQVQMGHSNARTLHRHYRALKVPKEAAAFWALSPTNTGAAATAP